MPTTVITGRDVTFTLDAADYDAQTTSAVLSCETIIETYQTLDGRAYKSVDKQWTFTIELLHRIGELQALYSRQCGQMLNQQLTPHSQLHLQP
jgi:hypothetical protein